jgi:hypothetical protein
LLILVEARLAPMGSIIFLVMPIEGCYILDLSARFA